MSLSDSLRRYVPAVVNLIVDQFDRNRSGCYVCLVSAGGRSREDLATIDPLLHELFKAVDREPAAEKSVLWQKFSREKIARTAMHSDHLSSFQSEDPNAEQYGGGIVYLCGGVWYGLSMSGWNAKIDEAGAVSLAVLMKMLDIREVVRIQNASGNEFIFPILRALYKGEFRDHGYLASVNGATQFK